MAPKPPRWIFPERCPDPPESTDNPERMDEVAVFTGLGAMESLGALPLAVVTAAEHPFSGLEIRGLLP